MTPVFKWLTALSKNKTFQEWLLRQLGPGALRKFREWTTLVRHRQAAIDHADQIDGHFSVAIVDGERRVVVWKAGEPVGAYPPAAGDLAEKLRDHARKDLKHPDELPTRRARKWFTGRAAMLRRSREAQHEKPGTTPQGVDGRERFEAVVERLPQLLEELERAPRRPVSAHPMIPATPGIYLFLHNGVPIYVGQSRNLRTRLTQHTATTARHNQASFAFNLAKRSARAAGLAVKRPRAVLESDPEFAKLFAETRKDVARMDVQFIQLHDPIARTLLEVYAALAVGTEEFNSFETH